MLLFENRVSLPVMPTFSRDITRGAAQKPFPKNISSQDFSRLDLTGLAECDSSTIFHRDRKELFVGLSNSTPLFVWLYGTLSNHHRTTPIGDAFLCGNQPMSCKRKWTWEEYYFKQSEAIPGLQRITNYVGVSNHFSIPSLEVYPTPQSLSAQSSYSSLES
jgi:hypothetical protein